MMMTLICVTSLANTGLPPVLAEEVTQIKSNQALYIHELRHLRLYQVESEELVKCEQLKLNKLIPWKNKPRALPIDTI